MYAAITNDDDDKADGTFSATLKIFLYRFDSPLHSFFAMRLYRVNRIVGVLGDKAQEPGYVDGALAKREVVVVLAVVVVEVHLGYPRPERATPLFHVYIREYPEVPGVDADAEAL